MHPWVPVLNDNARAKSWQNNVAFDHNFHILVEMSVELQSNVFADAVFFSHAPRILK